MGPGQSGPVHAGTPATGPRTLYQLAEIVIVDCAPTELPVLRATADALSEKPVRDRMVRTVLGSTRRQTATAFDAQLGQLTLQLTLLMLNGVATGAIDPADTARPDRVTGWWRRRRLAYRLARRHVPADAQLPVFTIEQATAIGQVAHRLAGRAGMSAEDADRFARRLVAVLSPPDR